MLYKKSYWNKIVFFFILCILISIRTNASTIQSSIVNSKVAKYMTNVNYTKYTRSRVERYTRFITERSSFPIPITIPFPAIDENIRVVISRKDYYHSFKMSGDTGNAKIYNLIPGITYDYEIYDAKRELLQSGSLKPTGSIRMLYVKGGRNIRDLGGWKTANGKHIRYGLIYRGAQLDSKGHIVDKQALTVFQNCTGIVHDIDLRTAKEAANSKASPMGTAVTYHRYSLKPYIINTKANKKLLIKTLRCIFNAVDHKEPVYFHCVLGADRTGTVSFLIEGLLGVSESNLAKDYELTSFYELRTKEYYKYKSLLKQLKKCKGKSLQKKFENYFISLGFSAKEIRKFQNNMLQ